MKKVCCFLLALLLVLPSAAAAYDFDASGWARDDVEKALDMKLTYEAIGDCKRPISRGDYARCAATLAAYEYGVDFSLYWKAVQYRDWLQTGELGYNTDLKIAHELGILLGRGEGDYDEFSNISRQDAATMLARTYRVYAGEVSPPPEPVTFADGDEIAAWAKDDVQLMHHMGIMNGVGNGRFDPLGDYTVEQCLVTLVRLHEKAPIGDSAPENPFVMTAREKVVAEFWTPSSAFFSLEADPYYVLMLSYWTGGMAPGRTWIYIVDNDAAYRSYRVPLYKQENPYYGRHDITPETAVISEDGTQLIYTTTIENDAMKYDSEGNTTLLFSKGIYTVTMDLATGEQTWTREDLPADGGGA